MLGRFFSGSGLKLGVLSCSGLILPSFSTFASGLLFGISGSLSLSASAGVADLLEGGVIDLLGEGLRLVGEVDLLGLLDGVLGPA